MTDSKDSLCMRYASIIGPHSFLDAIGAFA
jgi:hypothetical protein